jgi:TMEM199 family protein
MAHLRREEELRAYERMTNPAPPQETFAQRFPTSSAANAFAMNHQPAATEEDQVVYADIDRQIALILNVLVSIVACAGAIWVVARWWSTPVRLALSMSGSALVGVAEVVVYSGYIRRVGEAKGKERKMREVKEVVKTWVIGGDEDRNDTEPDPVLIESKEDVGGVKARKWKKGVGS